MNIYAKLSCFSGLWIFFATEVFASTDSYVETQIDADRMATLVRKQLAGKPDFCPYEITCPFPSVGPCIADHFEYGPPGTWSMSAGSHAIEINNFTSVIAHRLLYQQSATFYARTKSCAENPFCASYFDYPVTLTYQLYMNEDAELCVTTYSSTGLPPGVTPPSVNLCLGFDAEGLGELSGQTSGAISGKAVALSGDGERIAMRFELGRSQADYTAARIAAWESFVEGATNTDGATGEWSTLVHQSLVLAAFQQRVLDGFASVPGFSLTSGLSTSWTPNGSGGVTLGLVAGGEITEGCDVDVDDLTFVMSTGLNAEHNGLTTNAAIGWNLDEGDIILCALAFGGPAGGLVLAALISSISVNLDLGPTCQATGDATFTCSQITHPKTLMLGSGQMGKLDLDAALGTASGLVFAGDLALAGSGSVNSWVSASAPKLAFHGNCSTTECEYVGSLTVNGNAKICDVNFSHDDLGIFDIAQISSSLVPPASFLIAVDATAAEKALYQADPYSVWATVWTSVGVKTYELPELELESQADEVQFCGVSALAHWASCLELQDPNADIYSEVWFSSWLINPAETPVEILTPARQFLDYGLFRDLSLDIGRDRDGVVTSIIIHGQIYAGLGAGARVVLPVEIPLAVPPATMIATDGELIATLLPRGYMGTLELDRSRISPALAGTQFDLTLTPGQLDGAADDCWYCFTP